MPQQAEIGLTTAIDLAIETTAAHEEEAGGVTERRGEATSRIGIGLVVTLRPAPEPVPDAPPVEPEGQADAEDGGDDALDSQTPGSGIDVGLGWGRKHHGRDEQENEPRTHQLGYPGHERAPATLTGSGALSHARPLPSKPSL